MSFTAKDVQNLRQATGAGMMDAKRALEETGGDFDAAAKLLREKGLAKSVDRSDRENTQGVVAVASAPGAVAIVELKCETDFVAKSDDFVAVAQDLADSVAPGRLHRRAQGAGRRPEGPAQGEHRHRPRRAGRGR